MPISQLRNAFLQKLSLPSRSRRFHRNSLSLGVSKTIDHNWGKYPLDFPNNVALDHLSRDVGDESLLRNLMRSY
jgi:hypothetical protein